MHRFFILNKQNNPKENIIPTKELLHQLIKVLRVREDEEFVCIYQNLELICKLINKQIIVIEDNEFIIDKNRKITLLQSIPKIKKISLIIQKATELDVDEIIFWESNRSIVPLKNIRDKFERFEKIIIEACEQSRRNDIPKLKFISSLEDVDFLNKEFFVFYENEKKLQFIDSLKNRKSNDLVLVIGPEGGFEEREINFFKEKETNIVSLGKNILRTETSAIASIAIVNSEVN
ncbi:MAG: ribosomal RNA small subunit methyltransferase E [Candidatus Tyloplasma litorale]|nr:MAG: ribosomal RNA small subunit methyltransferase E [Mycoplasmatales bacterium]